MNPIYIYKAQTPWGYMEFKTLRDAKKYDSEGFINVYQDGRLTSWYWIKDKDGRYKSARLAGYSHQKRSA